MKLKKLENCSKYNYIQTITWKCRIC